MCNAYYSENDAERMKLGLDPGMWAYSHRIQSSYYNTNIRHLKYPSGYFGFLTSLLNAAQDPNVPSVALIRNAFEDGIETALADISAILLPGNA